MDDDALKSLIDSILADADGADAQAYRAASAAREKAKEAWERGAALGVAGVVKDRSKVSDEPGAATT